MAADTDQRKWRQTFFCWRTEVTFTYFCWSTEVTWNTYFRGGTTHVGSYISCAGERRRSPLHRRQGVRQRGPVHQPLVWAERHARASLHRTSGGPRRLLCAWAEWSRGLRFLGQQLVLSPQSLAEWSERQTRVPSLSPALTASWIWSGVTWVSNTWPRPLYRPLVSQRLTAKNRQLFVASSAFVAACYGVPLSCTCRSQRRKICRKLLPFILLFSGHPLPEDWNVRF